MLTKELLSEYIDAGAAKIKADMVIIGGTLVNVNTEEYYPANVAIYKKRIIAVDSDIKDYIGENTRIIDATDKYLVPGLIDCHIHVECSKMSMTRLHKLWYHMEPLVLLQDLMNIFLLLE